MVDFVHHDPIHLDYHDTDHCGGEDDGGCKEVVEAEEEDEEERMTAREASATLLPLTPFDQIRSAAG